jgi:RNA polymerase sigma-70 factor (ECF subfamily)
MNPLNPSEPYPSSAGPGLVRGAAGSGLAARPRAVDADLELVSRMQRGDEGALGEFYDYWYPVVSGVLSRMLKAADDVEDVVEETFWQVWRQAGRFTAERGSVQTWLLTIARSRALDRLRATRRLREESIDESGVQDAGRSAAIAGAAQSSSDPLLDAEQAERKQLVGAALAELPAEQREVLEMGYFGGLSQSEIAERTGHPLGTVKTRMRLAMLKLRDRLSLLREDAR